MKKSSKSKAAKPSFEDALAELEKTVVELEDGSLGLDKALARHMRGVELLTRCRTLLDSAARKVSLLVDVDSAGLLQTVPFDSPHEELSPPNFDDEDMTDPEDDDDDDLIPF